jgi:hypothetical protein
LIYDRTIKPSKGSKGSEGAKGSEL